MDIVIALVAVACFVGFIMYKQGKGPAIKNAVSKAGSAFKDFVKKHKK